VRRLLAALLALAATLAVATSAGAVIPGSNGPIAFSPTPQGEYPQIFLVNPDGSFLSQVTADPYGAQRPVWFPDGRRVGYAAGQRRAEVPTAAVLDVASGETRPPRDADLISSNMFYSTSGLAWAPDGARIAYPTRSQPSRIKLVTRGAGTTDLTAGTDPDWSPTGTRLVFARDSGLYTINADGTGETQVLAPPGGVEPSWSPDGSRIAFLSIVDSLQSTRLEVMHVDGSGRTVIATGPIGRLAWSPDGSRIAFVRGVPVGGLWTINPDGSAPALVTSNALYFSWGTGPRLTRRLLPPPDARRVNASVVRGTVRVKRRGQRRFTRLTGEQQIPYGSLVDTRRGRVRIVADAGGGKTQTAEFQDGLFRIVRRGGARPVTELVLAGPLAGCRATRSRVAAAARKGRRLWGDGKGRFRTRGRRSAATVTGTKWLVEDRCDTSTLTKVTQGKVEVRDFARRRTITLRKGQSYIARPPGRRRR
jgi:hypothetical protein